MIAIIFEVTPRDGKLDSYLKAAAMMRSELEKMDGFISVERFRSLINESKYLSLSFWRDEEAVIRWRNHSGHRLIQARGRNDMFEDYRLRVAGVMRDYGMFEREQTPEDSKVYHHA
jgi:heme-degrading monooxygenase HmoA